MQFRVQANRIQCIRSTYDPAIQRSRQQVVASFDRTRRLLPGDDELGDITTEEKAELVEWFANYRAELQAANSAQLVSGVHYTLKLAADALPDDVDLTEEQAMKIYHAIDRLQR